MYHAFMAKKKTGWPKRLYELRKRLGGITQEQAAARVRVSRRAWVKWECGQQVPSPAHQLLIDLLEQEKI